VTTTEPTIRWGILGCGAVTEVKSGPAFQRAVGSRLVAVMRRSGALARDYAERHGVPRWYDSAEALIGDSEVDAVYIATPPSSHRAYTLLCAEAGKPVYVEKPMALNFAECQEMLAACREAGVPLFVAYYRRALPRFLKIKELVDSGALGAVRYVRVDFCEPPRPNPPGQPLPWRVQPAISGGGYFVDLASHMLDFLDYVLGPITRAQGFAANQSGQYPAEDIVTGSFVFASGAQGVGSWCFSGPASWDVTTLVGSQATLTYSTFDARPLRLTTGASTTEIEIADPPHIQQPLIQQVVDALARGSPCASTGESAARISWVMDQMRLGYSTPTA
jgi:predicted dehydrogenase